MTAQLHIAADVALPLDLALASVDDFGQRGTGKTYTAGVLVEDMLEAGLPIVVIDPTDVWWGLRSSADGKGDGYPVYVFGGPHADVPLEEGAGELIADTLIDSGISAVLSIGHLRKGKQHAFFTAFAERFYFRKNELEHRTPVHVVIDEAHSFAPSTVTGDTARMVGAVEDLVRLGRSRGIGVSLVSQRPKAVNANVRTQAEALVCHRLLDKLDRDAVKEWVASHDDAARGDEFMRSLGGLKRGEAWVWYPDLDIFRRVVVRKKRTFDSSATPKVGEKPRVPRRLTQVDVKALGEQIAATVEREKTNDPRTLRAEVQRLTRELQDAEQRDPHNVAEALHWQQRAAAAETREVDLNKRVSTMGALLERITSTQVASIESSLAAAATEAQHIRELANEVSTTLFGLPVVFTPEQIGPPAPAELPPRPQQEYREVTGEAARAWIGPAAAVKIGKGERTVLEVLAAYPEGRTQEQLCFLAGYSRKASTVGVILATLRRAGFVASGQPIRLTAEGMAAAGGHRALPRGPELLAYWLRHPKVGGGERRVLQALIDHYPKALTHEQLCAVTEYSPTASTVGVILAALRRLGLVEARERRMAAEFMEAIA